MGFDLHYALHIFPLLLRASLVTISVTVASFAIALLGGLIIVLLRRSNQLVNILLGSAVEFIRSTPLLVQILFIYLALPRWGIVLTAFQTGVIAMSLHYSCYLSEVYRAGLESIPREQWDGSSALNFSAFDRYRSVILPQLVPRIVPAAGNFLVYMFKDSPLLAAISLVELVFTAEQIGSDTFRYLEPMTLVGAIFLVLSLGAARLITLLENRIGAAWLPR